MDSLKRSILMLSLATATLPRPLGRVLMLAIAALLTIAATTTALGQRITGTLTGRVTDPTGR
jgi:hypothetical protein